jgi:hypothetical protein
MSLAKLGLAIFVVLRAGVPALAAEAPIPVAVFPFTITDNSGSPSTGQPERLAAATVLLAHTLLATGKYRPVDLTPYAGEMAKMQPPDECGTCWAALARKAGASLEFIPSVQKVSVLISQMTIWVADVKTLKYTAHIQGQIRGDTSEAYTHGVEFLIGGALGKHEI